MRDGGRIAGGLMLLIVLWIGVYWWWPAEPKITIAQGDDTVRGVAPKHEYMSAPKPEASKPPVAPPLLAPKPEPTAPPPSQPPPAVIPPEFVRYTLKKGETAASVAKQFYGSEALASVIIAANPETSPQNIVAGRTILIPKDPNNIQGIPVKPSEKTQDPKPAATEAPAERTYVVQGGDSLSKIAQEMYGDLRLSSLIFEANRDQLSSEDAIKPGQRLKIPAKPQR